MTKSARILRVALIQQKCSNDYKTNLAASVEAIKKAANEGAELILLQELHTGLYFCQQEKAALCELAESIPGPTTDLLSNLAAELNIVIVASIFERRAAGLYHNTAVVLEKNGEIAGLYRKMHIPDDPGYYEKFYFTPGDIGFKPIATSVGKLGVLVCWDQWYPEAARLMALAGAEILLYPTAIGWGTQEQDNHEKKRQRDAWITIQRGHAIANALPILVCNRVGFEASETHSSEGINFWGSSFIAGPQGEFLAEAGQEQPEILSVALELDRTEHVRRGWPFLRDRRIDAYQGLLQRYLDDKKE